MDFYLITIFKINLEKNQNNSKTSWKRDNTSLSALQLLSLGNLVVVKQISFSIITLVQINRKPNAFFKGKEGEGIKFSTKNILLMSCRIIIKKNNSSLNLCYSILEGDDDKKERIWGKNSEVKR